MSDPLPLVKRNIPKVMLTAPFDLFEIIKMPFGFRILQRHLDCQHTNMQNIYAHMCNLD